MPRNMDTTSMEEPLRKLINAPDMSHARESAVKVKTWAKDEEVKWPEEAVRRTCLKRINASGLVDHLLEAYTVSKVAQALEEEEVVRWSGDVCGLLSALSIQRSGSEGGRTPHCLGRLTSPGRLTWDTERGRGALAGG